MSDSKTQKFTIVGGGLGGALMAVYLGQAGYDVEVYEMRADMRGGNIPGGRSINLALSHRGIVALERVGLAEEILKTAVPMRGRMIHEANSSLKFQPYGKDDSHVIHSVSRGGLNVLLLEAADRLPNVKLFFNKKCTDVQLDTGAVEILDMKTNETTTVDGGIVVSADGAFSAVRRPMQKLDRFDYSQDYLRHGFKELVIPPGKNVSFQMARDALHIWPRKSFMMIALPNEDGSYTCTLFWPFTGPHSFDKLQTKQDVESYFREHFPDAVPLMPTLMEDYFTNATSSLCTVRCGPWYYRDKVVLLGDAAHAVVPFYGQGMNASFEDVLVLCECMEKHKPNWEKAFREYFHIRKEHVDVLANLAISNFVEMRDHTGSKMFRLKKSTEKFLSKLLPFWYTPLYNMTTHTRMLYGDAIKRAKYQNRVVATTAITTLVIIAGVILKTLLF